MKCFLTGATGHVGCTLARELLSRGHSVVAYVRSTSDISSLAGLNIEYAYGDITDPFSMEPYIISCDIIFHIAGFVDIGSGNLDKLYNINVRGTKAVADLCLKHKKRLLYMSLVHAIHELPEGQTMREITDFSPDKIHGNYGKTKAEATAYVYSLKKNGLDFVIVHPSGIVGPYEYRISSLGQFIISYSTGKLPSYIDGMYNFVDVRDVCWATAEAAFRARSGECYLLTGECVSVRQLLDIMNDITGIKQPRIKTPYNLALWISPVFELCSKIAGKPPLFTPYSVRTLRSNGAFDNTKARTQLGFSPRPIYETVNDTYEWLKQNGKIAE